MNIIIWEPGRHWRNAVIVPLAIVLSPVILAAFVVVVLVQAVLWPFTKLFPPKPSMAADMVKWLDVVVDSKDADENFEAAFDSLTAANFDAPRLVAIQLRIKELSKQLDDPPWSSEVIAEFETMRESARALVGDRT